MKNLVRLAGAMGVVGALALTGCGKTLENDSITSGVESKVAEAGVTASSVSCPKDVKVKKGDTFTCTVTLETGQTFDVTLEQTDDNGTLNIDDGGQVFVGSKVASQLESALSSGSTTVTATCPNVTILPGGNGTFQCTAVASDGASATIVIPVRDGKIVESDIQVNQQ